MARAPAKKGGKKSSGGGGKRNAPGWMWLITGLAVGLFIAFLVFLGQHESKPSAHAKAPAKEHKTASKEKEKEKPKETPAPVVVAKATPAKPEAAPKTAETPKAEEKKPEKKPMNYDFYKRLPSFEVEVPEEKNNPHPKPLASPGTYILQAGSFKSAKEAEARKAELALLGIISTVQAVPVEGKPPYHRVRVGPYRDLDRLNKVRQTLRENNIDFVVLKEQHS